MSEIKNPTKQKLEHLFGMKSGYVLDFSNASFQDFILTSVGIDVDIRYPDGSKANRLRTLWQNEPNDTVTKLMHEMLDRWQTNALMDGSLSTSDQILFEQATKELDALTPREALPTAEEIEFLDKDFGSIDLSRVPVPLTFKEVIEQRRSEIRTCLSAKAPLAVIFLCGSTLEGLLFAVAEKNPKDYNQAKAAPVKSGKVKPLNEWTLQNLIDVSRELNLVGEDVSKHAHAVRDFRNYIHPRQQIRENFTPRMITAEIADKVLQAALSDLAAVHNG